MIEAILGFFLIYETQTIMKGARDDLEKNDFVIRSITIYFEVFLQP